MASVRERVSATSGTTWQVLYRHGSRQTSRTFTDPKKAKRFASLVDALGADRAIKELFAEGRPDSLTVAELAAQFLEWKASNVTPRTMTDYRRDVANWIVPWFGHRAAESVDEADVQKWVDHMATKLAPKSVADRHMLLHSMFKFGKARSRQLVGHNPCLETELPKAKRRPVKGTTVPEWKAILRAAERRNPDAGDLILFLGSVGWRWSEAAALDVRDVEDDGRDVWVDVTRVFRIVDNRQVLVEDAAKSEAAFRRVRLPTKAREMMRRRLVGKGPGDFVFTNRGGRHWNQNTFLRDTWPALLGDAGVGSPTRKPTPHWLRHMAVAVMARSNVPMHEIQRIIGHESVITTNGTYGSMITTLSATSLANIDAVLDGRTPGDVVSGEVVSSVVAELD